MNKRLKVVSWLLAIGLLSSSAAGARVRYIKYIQKVRDDCVSLHHPDILALVKDGLSERGVRYAPTGAPTYDTGGDRDPALHSNEDGFNGHDVFKYKMDLPGAVLSYGIDAEVETLESTAVSGRVLFENIVVTVSLAGATLRDKADGRELIPPFRGPAQSFICENPSIGLDLRTYY